MEDENIVNRSYILVTILVTIVLVLGAFAGLDLLPKGPTSTSSTSSILNAGSKIQVVAAENFWGSLVSQLGGDRVRVLSIVSDPNVDPHQYESSTVDARAIANASLVI